MIRKRKAAKQDILFKNILIVELIICYLALLTVISYVRGPERYQRAEEPLLTTTDFVSFNGSSASFDMLPMENDDTSQPIGWQAHITLLGVDRLWCSFQLDCPAESAGGILHIDLYNQEAGYDNPEQEYQVTLQPGYNEIEFELSPGTIFPETAQIRFFTWDIAHYNLQDIQIYEAYSVPSVSEGMIIGAGACFCVLLVTVILWVILKKSVGEGNRRGK